MAQATPKINILILGKVGAGKSSTGNTLSRSSHFDACNNTMSETVSISKHSEFDIKGYTFVIFDTQGLMDTFEAEYEGIKRYSENMETAIKACGEAGLSVFLLVFNLSCKISQEDKRCIDLLETIFGKDDFWNRCIIVLPRGDVFEGDFQEWIAKQTNEFKDMIDKCNRRVLLLINKMAHEQFEKYRQDLIDKIIRLRTHSTKTYNIADYKKSESKRNNFLLDIDLKKCKLDEDLEEKLSALRSEAQKVKSQLQRESVLAKIIRLRSFIEEKDKSTGKLEKYLHQLNEVELKVPKFEGGKCIIA